MCGMKVHTLSGCMHPHKHINIHTRASVRARKRCATSSSLFCVFWGGIMEMDPEMGGKEPNGREAPVGDAVKSGITTQQQWRRHYEGRIKRRMRASGARGDA